MLASLVNYRMPKSCFHFKAILSKFLECAILHSSQLNFQLYYSIPLKCFIAFAMITLSFPGGVISHFGSFIHYPFSVL